MVSDAQLDAGTILWDLKNITEGLPDTVERCFAV
jgi:hypothetical protein